MSEKYKKILIIKPSSLGDIIQALPAIGALKRSFPDAHISWLVRPEFASLIENHRYIDEIIVFDRKLLGKALYNFGAIRELFRLIGRLRRGKFDVVFDFQGLFRTACFGWLSSSRRRFGMKGAREFATIFYTDAISQMSECIHLVDYYMKIVAAAGANDLRVEFLMRDDGAGEQGIKGLLEKFKIKGDYAVLVPSSIHMRKCWPAERFAMLADKISGKWGLNIVATGTGGEKGLINEIVRAANVEVVNLAGLTSLCELMALIKGARVVVSNDTGPGHIACAHGRPVVMIFGSSNPARVAPYGQSNAAVAVEADGRGFKADSFEPKHDVKMITVEQVYEKVCAQI